MLNRVVFMLMGVVGVLCAFANGGGGAGSQNRRGSGNNFIRGAEYQRRGQQSMGDYYRMLARRGAGGVQEVAQRSRVTGRFTRTGGTTGSRGPRAFY